MKYPISYKDKHGQYVLWTEDRILMSEVKGQVGLSMAKRFSRDFLILSKEIENQPWAYFSDLSQCGAYTEQAFEQVIETYKYAEAHNCAADAYLISSPVLIHQVDKLRQANAIPGPIEKVIFNTKLECLDFIKRITDRATTTI